MSLIIGYASVNGAVIMSDGRAGIDGSYSEYYNKTMRINKNIIIGFAGIKEKIEFFLNHAIEQMGLEREHYCIDDFLYMIDFFMNDEETRKNLQSSFIIIGRDKDNHIHTAMVGDVTGFIIQRRMITTPRLLSIGGTIDGSIIYSILKGNIAKPDLSTVKAMEKTISDVSLLDRSVNANTFILTL